MRSDPISEEIWAQHEEWLDAHQQRKHRAWMLEERWSKDEWLDARALAEDQWDGSDFYLYSAIRALEAIQWRRMREA